MITKELFEKGYSYEEYRALINKLYESGKTTGTDHSEAMLDYTKMNIQRMNRLDKTIEINEEIRTDLATIPDQLNWLVLTEAWCGDAAQNIPILSKMANASSKIHLRFLLRDENLEVMDQYLTNGGRAIPKLIMLDQDFNEIASWGPRPSEVQNIVLENKRTANLSYSEFAKVVQKWYAKDKGETLQREMMEILQRISYLLDE
jgi:hypothetical protein